MASEHWTVDPQGQVPLKISESGPASTEPMTVCQAFRETCTKVPANAALAVKRDGEWKRWTYGQYQEEVTAATKGFIALGLEQYHSVGIIGFNSPEWFFSFYGAIFAGGFAAGIYTTNTPEAVAYVGTNSNAQIMVVEDDKQLQKVLAIKKDLPLLKAIVQYSGEPDASLDDVYSWAQFLEKGKDITDEQVDERVSAQTPANCCSLIFTSGTTGNPKAVMISHDNLTWTAKQTCEMLGLGQVPEHIISYLPLSHIAAQMVDLVAPMFHGGCIHFASPDALRGSLVVTLKEVRPTLFLGVPRVWEKIQESIKTKGAETTGLKKSIATWAKGKGLEGNMNKQKGASVPWGWWLADKLVFNKVKGVLGLDRARVLATAAAPITKDTLDFFLSLDLPIQEIYGMSECTGPQTVSTRESMKTGWCGQSLPGTEILIKTPDKDGNGEVCFRGRHIFMGYLGNETKTMEAIDPDGYLCSGDVGQVTEDGYLRITGRIKEMLITAGGENVAPVLIEDAMKEEMGLISNCMVIGDNKKFLGMFVTLKVDVDPETAAPTSKLTKAALAICERIGSTATTVEEAQKCEKISAYLDEGRKKANTKAISRAQNIQKQTILPVDFSIPGGELGPTLKLKRPVVYKMYDGLIKEMYGEK